MGKMSIDTNKLRGQLLALEQIVGGFHAVKQIRAHAAEENVQIKRTALALIGEMTETLGGTPAKP